MANTTLAELGIPFYDADLLLENKESTKELLEAKGLLLLKNVHSDNIAINITKLLGGIHYCIDSDSTGITVISNIQKGKNIKNSLAFTQAALYPHTDRSPIEVPPKYLLNWCIQPGRDGGDILLCDGKQVFDHLKIYHPETCQALMEQDAAEFSDTIDTYIGPIFTCANDQIKMRFRRDNCIQLKPQFHEHIHILYEAIDMFTIEVKAKAGEGYLVDNTRWLHGRTVFHGNRTIKRMQIYI